MKAERRLWRTDDGRLVEDGDEAARILAYAAGDEIAEADRDKVPGVKVQAKPADKQRRPAANKARG